ncbi:hypothetical protein ACTFIY_006170 [Dictyostelium cf. discoideum]
MSTYIFKSIAFEYNLNNYIPSIFKQMDFTFDPQKHYDLGKSPYRYQLNSLESFYNKEENSFGFCVVEGYLHLTIGRIILNVDNKLTYEELFNYIPNKHKEYLPKTWNPLMIRFHDRNKHLPIIKDIETLDWVVQWHQRKSSLELFKIDYYFDSIELSNHFIDVYPITKDLQYYYEIPFLKAIIQCNIQEIKHFHSLGIQFERSFHNLCRLPYSLNERLLNQEDESIYQEYNTLFNFIFDNKMQNICINGFYEDEGDSNNTTTLHTQAKFNLSKIKINTNLNAQPAGSFFKGKKGKIISTSNYSRFVIENFIIKDEEFDFKDLEFPESFIKTFINQFNKSKEIIKTNNQINTISNNLQKCLSSSSSSPSSTIIKATTTFHQANLQFYFQILVDTFLNKRENINYELIQQIYQFLIENQLEINIETKDIILFFIYKRSKILYEYYKSIYRSDEEFIESITLEFIRQSPFNDLLDSIIIDRPYKNCQYKRLNVKNKLKLFMLLKRNDLFLKEWEYSSSTHSLVPPSIRWCCLNLELSSINNILKEIGENYSNENGYLYIKKKLFVVRFCKTSLQLGKTDITKSSFTIFKKYFISSYNIKNTPLHKNLMDQIKNYNENDYLIEIQ